jgi:hypothetical protein
MNKIILFVLAVFAIQFSSCKKDEVTSRSPIYTVIEYRDSKLFREYAYTTNRLMHFYSYNYSGALTDSVQFFYSSNRLDSLYTYSFSSGENYLTKYSYNNDQLVSIDKWYSHNYNKKFTLSYDNFNELGQIEYTSNSQPTKGVLNMNRYGNVVEHSNEYVASIFNENFEANTFSYSQNINVLSPFWIIDPTEFIPSKNLMVEHIQNTSATNDGSINPNAQWFYKGDKWDIEYTFSTDGNMLTKTILDSSQHVLVSYEYEYLKE